MVNKFLDGNAMQIDLECKRNLKQRDEIDSKLPFPEGDPLAWFLSSSQRMLHKIASWAHKLGYLSNCVIYLF